MMDVKEKIEKKLGEILSDLTEKNIVPQVKLADDLSHGDYYSNIAMQIFGNSDVRAQMSELRSSLELAQKITESLIRDSEFMIHFSKIEAVAPGFINFWVSKEYLLENLSEIEGKAEKFGSCEINKGKKAVVEFSSPNIAKPFTVGHLRSTIIGQASANLMRATGWEVITDNHLGDWGTQFGKQIYAIKTWGDEVQIEKSENPVKELVALYVRFHEEAEKDPSIEDSAREWFKRLEDGDGEAKRLWQRCVEWSMKEFEKLYGILNVSFDTSYGESFYEDKMGEVVGELRQKNLLKKDEGAELVYFADDKYPPLMILKSDGTTLYATRDLATDKFRLGKYGEGVVIVNEVGAEQSLYFQQLFELEKMLSWVNDGQRIHVRHGLYRFADQKMSTRKGNTIWLEDVLEEAQIRAKKLGKEDSVEDPKAVSMGAIKWNDLKREHIHDIVFDWDDLLNMQGNSGPYIQYSYVRTRSLLNKAIDTEFTGKNPSHNLEQEEELLLRMLSFYPLVVLEASDSFSTSSLCNYLYNLSQTFNLFYQKHTVLGEEDKKEFRLRLSGATGQVIKNGLSLLGIETVARM